MSPLPSIEALARDAGDAISDLLSTEEEWDKFEALSNQEQIQYRYLHADCDDFALALSLATGWEIRAVNSERGPLHRLVSDPAGRLLDASGWTSMEEIKSKYGCKLLSISEQGAENVYVGSTLNSADDEDFHEVCAAMLLIDVPPLSTDLRTQIEDFSRKMGLNPGSRPKPGRAPKQR